MTLGPLQWARVQVQPCCPTCGWQMPNPSSKMSTKRQRLRCDSCGEEYYAKFWEEQSDDPPVYDD